MVRLPEADKDIPVYQFRATCLNSSASISPLSGHRITSRDASSKMGLMICPHLMWFCARNGASHLCSVHDVIPIDCFPVLLLAFPLSTELVSKLERATTGSRVGQLPGENPKKDLREPLKH